MKKRLLTLLVAFVILPSCSTHSLRDPDALAARVPTLVQGAAQLACSAIPVSERPTARSVLSTIIHLADTDPSAAISLLSTSQSMAISFLWYAIHSVLDVYAPDAETWVSLSQQSVGAAASGCLKAIEVS